MGSNPLFALGARLRSLVRVSLEIKGVRKPAKTEAILGCTLSEFAAHIERQFLPGMNWANRNLWELDHITPMASAKTEAEAVALNHFTNLRPLWRAENRSKRDRITVLI